MCQNSWKLVGSIDTVIAVIKRCFRQTVLQWKIISPPEHKGYTLINGNNDGCSGIACQSDVKVYSWQFAFARSDGRRSRFSTALTLWQPACTNRKTTAAMQQTARHSRATIRHNASIVFGFYTENLVLSRHILHWRSNCWFHGITQPWRSTLSLHCSAPR